jgi:hypothetical protein
MAQVTSENITVAFAVSTRRRFLSQAAGVTAGGAVLAMAALRATARDAEPLTPRSLRCPESVKDRSDIGPNLKSVNRFRQKRKIRRLT